MAACSPPQVPKGGSGRAAERGRGGAGRGGAASWRAAPGPPPPLRGARRGCPDPFLGTGRCPLELGGRLGAAVGPPKFVGCEGRGWRCTGVRGGERGAVRGVAEGRKKKGKIKGVRGDSGSGVGPARHRAPLSLPHTLLVGTMKDRQQQSPTWRAQPPPLPQPVFQPFPSQKHKREKKSCRTPNPAAGIRHLIAGRINGGAKPPRSSPQCSGPHRSPTRGDGAVQLGCS